MSGNPPVPQRATVELAAAASELLQRTEARTNAPKIACPKCGAWESRVRDGRPSDAGYRRKRICNTCGKQFFTIERAA